MFNLVKLFVATLVLVGSILAGTQLAKTALDAELSLPVIVANDSGGTGSGSTGTGGSCC